MHTWGAIRRELCMLAHTYTDMQGKFLCKSTEIETDEIRGEY